MKLKPPKSREELMEYIGNSLGDFDLNEFIELFDWSGVDNIDLFYMTLHRMPSVDENIQSYLGENKKEAILSLLSCGEFQNNCVSSVLDSLSSKKRLIFIHIPKCAGNSVTSALSRLMPMVQFTITDANWVSKTDMFSNIRRFIDKSYLSEWVGISGHRTLQQIINLNILRNTDKLYTVIRSPVDVVISEANYIVKMLIDDPKVVRPDSREWIDAIRAAGFNSVPSRDNACELSHFILFKTGLTSKNPICNYLGCGNYASTMTAFKSFPIEICDISTCERWFKEKYNITIGIENRSNQDLKKSMLSSDEMGLLKSNVSEDEILYNCIVEKMTKSGSPSILSYDV